MNNSSSNWKLQLRYGKLKTEFKHYSVLADGVVIELVEGFDCRPGRAWMAMKTWAIDLDQSADMIQSIGNKIGFKVDGRVEIYDTAPEQPPEDKPFGYDIQFTPYGDE
jgi:hypothetical protein